jgi:four helix bundle protein
MFRFEELKIWRLAFKYSGELYRLTKDFPAEEKYALTDQLRRAGLSIPTNIAEGSAGTSREFIQYVTIAIRSTLETVSLLKFSESQRYISEATCAGLYNDAQLLIRKARSFQRSLQSVKAPEAICH